MQAQIRAWLDELEGCTAHARRLAGRAGEAGFLERPPSGRWSLGEHLVHLNLTTEAYLPLFDGILSAQAGTARDEQRRYRRDWLGAFLCWSVAPPVWMRFKTPSAFVPAGDAPRALTMAAFERLNQQLAERVRGLSGLDLNGARVASPFASAMQYNGWTAVTVLTAHQRRHLWLAEHP